MINYITINKPMRYIESVTCDICGTNYQCDGDEGMELQEFLHINLIGGYSSIFGDSYSIKCNICQYCLQKKLGDFLRIGDPEDE